MRLLERGCAWKGGGMSAAFLAQDWCVPARGVWSRGMEYTVPQFTKTQVDKAGAVLTNPKAWTMAWDIDGALEIINNHRASHNFPLLVFRVDLTRRAHKVDLSATIAQRIKRLRSIEAKLSRFPTMRLAHMQDIGGCRAVVRNVRMVRELANVYKKCRTKHRLLRFDDYLKEPRESGYRGIHLIYAYQSSTKPVYNGLKIEIQLRSRQQHAWATAVETVDVFTGQALKGGRGTHEWQRFFALMGTHIAAKERCPAVPDTPSDPINLRDQIEEYVSDLDVFNHLWSYQATLQTKDVPGADYYLLELNAERQETTIVGYKKNELKQAQDHYLALEKSIAGQRDKDAVLVSVSSLESLKRAYPNYFADTHVFIQTVTDAIREPQSER